MNDIRYAQPNGIPYLWWYHNEKLKMQFQPLHIFTSHVLYMNTYNATYIFDMTKGNIKPDIFIALSLTIQQKKRISSSTRIMYLLCYVWHVHAHNAILDAVSCCFWFLYSISKHSTVFIDETWFYATHFKWNLYVFVMLNMCWI